MDNPREPAQEEAGPKPKDVKSTLLVVEGILIMLLVFFSGFLAWQNQKLGRLSQLTPEPTPTEETWSKAEFESYTYQYPQGWHVAVLWPADPAKEAVVVAIDPKPVSTALKDGPLATFTITFRLNTKDPEAEFEKRVKTFTESVEGVSEEIISSDLGQVTFFKGKYKDGFFQGMTAQEYFLISGKDVFEASLLSDDSELTEAFRAVVLSFRKKS